MPDRAEQLSFDYAVIRVVPRVERGEFVNVGVIVFCLAKKLLLSKIHADEAKLRALWPEIDMSVVQAHLEAFLRVCRGDADGGPIARMSARERFHWLVAPRSTTIQISPVHSGLCSAPEAAVDKLFHELIA